MKTIMVDMDDVLTYGNFSKILEEYLGYRPDYDNIKNYYIQDILGKKRMISLVSLKIWICMQMLLYCQIVMKF